MRSELSDLFADFVTHESRIDSDLNGTPIYATPARLMARVIRRQRTVVGRSGIVAISRAQILLRDPANVEISDRFTLPDETTGSVLAVDVSPDELGHLYTKVYL